MASLSRFMPKFSDSSFQRDDGSKGVVCSGSIADETGPIRVSFWDEKANFKFKIGDAYKIENARTRMGMYAVELNAGKSTRILPLSEEEAIYLPSYETLEEMLYELEPEVVLVYGSMPKQVFGDYINCTKFIQYDNWTTRMHKGGDNNG